ncbi:MAG: hypothetical protein R2774_01570 [Saprospiraceae bacterium]
MENNIDLKLLQQAMMQHANLSVVIMADDTIMEKVVTTFDTQLSNEKVTSKDALFAYSLSSN